MTRDRAFDVIRKLRKKAVSCVEIGQEFEAVALEDKIEELMARYEIRQIDLDPPAPLQVQRAQWFSQTTTSAWGARGASFASFGGGVNITITFSFGG